MWILINNIYTAAIRIKNNSGFAINIDALFQLRRARSLEIKEYCSLPEFMVGPKASPGSADMDDATGSSNFPYESSRGFIFKQKGFVINT